MTNPKPGTGESDPLFDSEFIGGVPTELLVPGTSGYFKLRSGAIADVTVSDREIHITRPSPSRMRFIVTAEPVEPTQNSFESVLTFNFRTRDDGEQDADIHARLMVGAAFKFMDHYCDLPVTYVLDEYRPNADNDNYTRFSRALSEVTGFRTRQATDDDMLYAASKTWSGETYEQHNFYPSAVRITDSGTVWVAYQRLDQD